ncbi:transposase [Paraherbaspirillum soli]|uniref:Transposase n=1 Tax=Paraherbaspirillum soli TaxID=631222 RepID=A0ABW0MDL6_9BURK
MKLRDDQWAKLEPLLLGRQGDAGAKGRNNRLFIEAVLLLVSSKCEWSALPSRYGQWRTNYVRFRRWTRCNVWRQISGAGIDDSELMSKLNAIVEHGDQYTRRLQEKKSRKANSISYHSTLYQAGSMHLALPSEEESTSHWVRLVTTSGHG